MGFTRADAEFRVAHPPLDLSKYFKVIDHEPSIKDEDLNETIQRIGARLGEGSSEAEWYYKNKGYSQKL